MPRSQFAHLQEPNFSGRPVQMDFLGSAVSIHRPFVHPWSASIYSRFLPDRRSIMSAAERVVFI